MPLPVRPLPVLQNWDCRGCSDCCRTYHVRVSEAERKVIEAQNWKDDPAIQGIEPIVYDRRIGGLRLNHGTDGVCVFLGPDNRCRIHAKFGSAAKPLACRLYPFMLIPAGDHWRVGLRYACPATVADTGRPIPEHLDDLREYARIQESDLGRPREGEPPPPLQAGQVTTWPDLFRFTAAVSGLLSAAAPIERKLRTVLAFVALMRKSQFEKVTGHRLGEFLEVVSQAILEDVPESPESIARPGWVGRSLFRQVAAVFTRKDLGLGHGNLVEKGALGRMLAAWRFAVGRGDVPQVHGFIPPGSRFEAAERPAGAIPATIESLLTRYYRMKVESLQFCGRANFSLSVWDGIESLILTFPIIMWLSRVLAASGETRESTLEKALKIVDDNFGFNPLLGTFKQRTIIGLIRQKDELPRLVAWYGR
ncbi:MAG: YkgJ family cysteine cluster protein [Gemmataceae bacterium]